ncbi:MAG: type III toxin-antitoxin system ToxN/AbiQ family toxin, partial [Firmicutes bacterium]|nr:type III toxin-antitoxin system ToxN/AbiQ family toxin [Bacillota bacterium]
MAIKLYEVEDAYIDYLSDYVPHLFHNKKDKQRHSRKYIGIVLTINGLNYFAPLSSFKKKHHKMKNTVDLIKVGAYAVINLNNMFPVPDGLYQYVDFSKEKDANYRNLLMAE